MMNMLKVGIAPLHPDMKDPCAMSLLVQLAIDEPLK